jgi:hypothetical protein
MEHSQRWRGTARLIQSTEAHERLADTRAFFIRPKGITCVLPGQAAKQGIFNRGALAFSLVGWSAAPSNEREGTQGLCLVIPVSVLFGDGDDADGEAHEVVAVAEAGAGHAGDPRLLEE